MWSDDPVQPATQAETYKVWAIDNMVYGPIDLTTLIGWVQEGRVVPDTWVHMAGDSVGPSGHWWRAKDLAPLREHFVGVTDTAYIPRLGSVRPEELRQFALFSGLSNDDVEQFLHFSKLHEAVPGEVIIKKGTPCDAAYFVVSGQVRARLLVGLEDITLARIAPGEFFGELGMFIQSTRTADVVADVDTRLLRVTAQAFQLMIRQIPRLAAPLLFVISKSMAHRIADDNRKLQREVASGFLWK
ncbi:MAG TPA: cyclic nucleotide-binding domain-containing protein [Candidatus Binatia bacterium]|nr:cyclic nucleotide-binding domain-containing protein [Candidatus Binatia bacterium]